MNELRGVIKAVNMASGTLKLADFIKKTTIVITTLFCGAMLIKFFRK